MNQILGNPDVYQPLGNILKGKFRVHIGRFVLLFVKDTIKTINLWDLGGSVYTRPTEKNHKERTCW